MAKYYHITAKENLQAIIDSGIRANEDGEIFLFENETIFYTGIAEDTKGKKVLGRCKIAIADKIAADQIFLKEYVMLEIDSKGLNLALVKDEVAEFSAGRQWIARQPIIYPKYISLFGYYVTKSPELIEVKAYLDYIQH